MDRLERLVNLVAALVDADRPLTRAELRERVGGYSDDPGAFRRNFERDKDVLRQMGLPLVTEAVSGEQSDDQAGYRIPRERYELPDPGLEEGELAALRLASSAVRLDGPWGSDATIGALRKLAAAGDPSGGPAGRVGGAERAVAPAAELAGGDAVVAAFGAIADRRRLRFTYRGEERTIDPWQLSYRRGQWYLAGFDHRRDAERSFRLDRTEGPVEAVGDAGAFDRPAGAAAAPAPPWQLGDGPAVTVRVLVDAGHATWAVAAVGRDAVVADRPDGSVEIELAVTNRAGLHSWVVGFLDHAEILGPPGERGAFADRLRSLVAR